MESPDELAGDDTPPLKRRRRTLADEEPRSINRSSRPFLPGTPRVLPLATASRKRPSPSPSSSPSSCRSRQPRSSSRSSSRSKSAQRSSSRSPFRGSPSRDSPSRDSLSRLQARSRSCSSVRSPSASYSTEGDGPTPPPDSFKPGYQPRLILRGHVKPVSQVRISPDGRFIASASADATLKIWNAATGAHIDTLVGHMAGVNCLAWTPDSKTLASGSDDKAIRLWDRITGQPKKRSRKSHSSGREMSALRGHHNYIHCLAFSPKGNILASGSYDEAVFLWDVRAGRLMRSLPAHSDPVSGIDFCRDGTLVVSCSTDGLIRVWDTSTGQCLRTLVHEDNPAVTNVCFSPNGRFVLAFSLDNCIRLWDYVAGTVKKTYQGHVNEKFAIGGCFAVLDGAALIASASEDGDVVLWDVGSKEIVERVPGHDGVCFWVDVHGETVVSAGQDNTVRLLRRVEEAANGAAGPENEGDGAAANSELPIRQQEEAEAEAG
ncbi:hypothetical protein XA68_17064 [Ophiocordyceps unilateralis]|uniref:Mitochondrial division protein 1 n=1 Tax=Ophiocordyceps unilateralis TaxID=268505 RepID=A0A2A9P5F1_OPHUN|nr:hypothetical protein XA68_17064 [Ophiocordyceps unilateralis]